MNVLSIVQVLVKWYSDYVNRAVLLLSLFMYLILATLSDNRRLEGKGWKRRFVWVAYQLTEWAPSNVINNYLETSPREKMIIAFWVPFLLLHHARPDNISAYAMEDNELGPRMFVSALLMFVGSFFIVYKNVLTEQTAGGLLPWASGIMLLLGILKYLESTLALWRSDLGHIRDSGLSNKQMLKLSDYRDQGKLLELEDEKALLVAHDLFEICKGAFCDYTPKMDRDVVINMFSEDGWQSMCKVVEMELSLMYDILYTKAAVIHTWHGYAIRLVSPPLTATALLLFGLHSKEGMKPIDQVVSYILLCTTLLLDVRWLFRALGSAWTHSYFKLMPHNWLKHEFWCQGGWKKLRRFIKSLCISQLSLWLWTCACPKEPKSYRRWAGTFGQYNLLGQCTAGNRHNLYSIPRATEWQDHSSSRGSEREDNSRGLEIPDNVKKLVFQNIWEKLFRDPVELTDPQQPSRGDSDSPRLIRLKFRNAPPRPHHCPDEQVVECMTDCWRYNRAPTEPYEQVNVRGHAHTSANYERVLLNTREKAADIKPTEQSDEDMEFPPELQEAILIWHIATDVFLSCSPEITGEGSEEHVKVIKQMSDYMVFLVIKRPMMLPGLTLCSLHERILSALELIWKVAKPTGYTTKEKDVATWMLKNRDKLSDPDSAIWEGNQIDQDNFKGLTTVWGATQLARVLLSLPSNDGELEITEKGAGMVKGLKHWIPDLQELPGDTEGMLKFILDAWVRLLMFASIRCSRDSHAKRLSCRGERTTLVWIITEHTKNSVVKKHLKSLFR